MFNLENIARTIFSKMKRDQESGTTGRHSKVKHGPIDAKTLIDTRNMPSVGSTTVSYNNDGGDSILLTADEESFIIILNGEEHKLEKNGYRTFETANGRKYWVNTWVNR